jgi:formamidopyrimidine-DNA glycosylase
VPELPEVETVVRDLRPLLVGRTIGALRRGRKRLRKPWKSAWDDLLPGRRVEAINRRGKWIIVELDTGSRLLIHLGMTGQLVAVDAEAPLESHTHLVMTLDNTRHLRFRDIRRFGSATLFDTDEALQKFFCDAKLGPEPWELNPADWHAKVTGTTRALKALLLDQGMVAGVGNIYADEALFHSRLHPTLTGTVLDRVATERLRRGIVAVLERAIECRGSSIRNYVGGSGLRGGYQEEFRVYGRKGKPCVRCKTPVARMRLAGRATHYCPRCQTVTATSLTPDP